MDAPTDTSMALPDEAGTYWAKTPNGEWGPVFFDPGYAEHVRQWETGVVSWVGPLPTD